MRILLLAGFLVLAGCAGSSGYRPPSHYRSDLGPLHSNDPAGRLPPVGVLKGKKGPLADAFRVAAYAQLGIKAVQAVGDIIEGEEDDPAVKKMLKERTKSVNR